MGILTALALIVCGILAAAGLVIKKSPNPEKAREMIAKLTPYQGIIGVITCLLGIWAVIWFVLNMGVLLKVVPVFAILFIACGVAEVLLGFLLGYGLITKNALSGSPEAMAKGAAMQAKLISIQIPLGMLGIVLGLVLLVLNFVHM